MNNVLLGWKLFTKKNERNELKGIILLFHLKTVNGIMAL